MAITHNISQSDSEYGVKFDGAYYRISLTVISRERGSSEKFTCMIDLSAYATASPTDDTRQVDARRYHAPLTEIESSAGDTFLSKCYAWVMSQSDMSGSSAT
tara:strand:+ start:34 stop:339 length:306 start_codon:yes stop_codon:yes gene_type:complete